MARTRTHRRRRSSRVIVAVVVTLLVVVFGHEVSRSAHLETSARLSEDLSFGQLANTLLSQENSFDAQFARLLTAGSHSTRVDIAAQLSQLAQELTSWRVLATQMKSPVVSSALNMTLSNETATRATDYEDLLSYVAQALELPFPGRTPAPTSLGAVQSSLRASAASWGAERHLLAGAPGQITLNPLTHVSADLNIPQYVQTLSAAVGIATARAIEIAAIQVQPAPLPAAAQTLLLAPTTSVQVQVSVSNLREIVQPVSLTMVLTSSTGAVQQVTQTQTLSPLASFAFESHVFHVVAGEKGSLSVTLNGVPGSPGLTHLRTYTLSVSPSGTG